VQQKTPKKPKKKMSKRTRTILIVVGIVLVIGLFASSIDDNQDTNTSIPTDQNATPLSIEDELKQYANEYIGEYNLDIRTVSFYENSATIATIVTSAWDEDHMITNASAYATSTMEKVWSIDEVDDIKFYFYSTMIDSKGNESLDLIFTAEIKREAANGINYENFVGMVVSDYNRFLNLCTYAFHPGIEAKLTKLSQ